jgi:alpha-methylacyl-CoA racemase
MAALYERQTSGRGQVVDAAMVDGAASLASIFWGLQAAGQWREARGTNLLDGGAPFYATYETADGRWVALAALEPKFFAVLAAKLELPEVFVKRQYDRSQWPAMRDAMATAVRRRTRDAWCELLEGSEACFAPVLSLAEAPQHRHAQARGAFVTVEGVTQPAAAPRFDRTPASSPRPAPRVGQHTLDVLAQAGYDEAARQSLVAAGVARQAHAESST